MSIPTLPPMKLSNWSYFLSHLIVLALWTNFSFSWLPKGATVLIKEQQKEKRLLNEGQFLYTLLPSQVLV